ncbi:MAG TPA: hypothetical protein VLG93_07620, partial [Sulfuricaulis sp.]|nr:hypothetical protein [Sulfuricaulis sp.]
MADSNTSTSADPSLLQSLKLHLDGLKRTQHGLVLYNQIQRGLQKYGHEDGRIELVFVSFLHALLGKYATSPACDPSTRVKARLIQQRLTLYLPKAAPAPVAPKPMVAAARPAAPVEPRAVVAPPPPVAAAPIPPAPVAETRPEPKPAADPVPPVEIKPAPVIETKPEPVAEVVAPPVVDTPAPVAETQPVPPPEPAAPSRQENIEILGDTLAQQVTESIAV